MDSQELVPVSFGNFPKALSLFLFCAALLLWQEEVDAVGLRGLEAGTDRQTFEIFVPSKLREHWDTVLLTALDQELAAVAPGDRTLSLRLLTQTAHAQATINRYFMAFLDHSFRDLDYVVLVSFFFSKKIDAL